MHIIKDIHAKEILDSRGIPTIEVEMWTERGYGKASVPSGASTGKYEACELRDGENRYFGKGVLKAVRNINFDIRREIIGKSFEQRSMDDFLIKMDGTKNKRRLGANAILGVSLAFAHSSAHAEKKELYEYFKDISGSKEKFVLPVPMFNLINGGRHSKNGLDIQEVMILPVGARSFKEALNWGMNVYHTLGDVLKFNGMKNDFGDEGGYSPHLNSNESALKLISESIKESGFGKKVKIGIDMASSEFYSNGKYHLKKDRMILDNKGMISLYASWAEKYFLVSIEDPLNEDDFKGFGKITKIFGKKVKIVGDDLFVTNTERLKKGIQSKSGNTVLIKLNQVGTVSETISFVKMAKKAGYLCIVSHRSGETMDTTIADFAVGLGIEMIKSGSFHQDERIVKYVRLLRIEERLGKKAEYAGGKAWARR